MLNGYRVIEKKDNRVYVDLDELKGVIEQIEYKADRIHSYHEDLYYGNTLWDEVEYWIDSEQLHDDIEKIGLPELKFKDINLDKMPYDCNIHSDDYENEEEYADVVFDNIQEWSNLTYDVQTTLNKYADKLREMYKMLDDLDVTYDE